MTGLASASRGFGDRSNCAAAAWSRASRRARQTGGLQHPVEFDEVVAQVADAAPRGVEIVFAAEPLDVGGRLARGHAANRRERSLERVRGGPETRRRPGA